MSVKELYFLDVSNITLFMPAYQPVSRESHQTKRWIRPATLDFAAGDVSCTIAAFEVYKCAAYVPIAFLKSGDSYRLSIVQGLKEGQNLYVGPNGIWLPPYAPAIYRFHPFRLAALEEGDDRKVLCILDESVVSENSAEGKAFFTEEGELDPDVSVIFHHLTSISASFEETKTVCEVLESNKLIKPWNVKVNHSGVESSLRGLHCIDETKFRKASGKILRELRDVGALPVIYCQLFSMQQITRLSRIAQSRNNTRKLAEDPAEIFAFDPTDNGSINFDNL